MTKKGQFIPQIFQGSVLVDLIGAVLHINLEMLGGLLRKENMWSFLKENTYRFCVQSNRVYERQKTFTLTS